LDEGFPTRFLKLLLKGGLLAPFGGEPLKKAKKVGEIIFWVGKGSYLEKGYFPRIINFIGPLVRFRNPGEFTRGWHRV